MRAPSCTHGDMDGPLMPRADGSMNMSDDTGICVFNPTGKPSMPGTRFPIPGQLNTSSPYSLVDRNPSLRALSTPTMRRRTFRYGWEPVRIGFMMCAHLDSTSYQASPNGKINREASAMLDFCARS